MSHATLHGNNVSVFSVWIIPGISFGCQVSWHCAQPREHFLFLPSSVCQWPKALRRPSDSLWPCSDLGSQVVPSKVTRHSDGSTYFCTFRSWMHLRPFHLHWVSTPLAVCCSPCSVFLGGIVFPGHRSRLVSSEKTQVSTRLSRVQLPTTEEKDTFLLQLEALTFYLKDPEKYSQMSTPRWWGSQGHRREKCLRTPENCFRDPQRPLAC